MTRRNRLILAGAAIVYTVWVIMLLWEVAR